jgi:hypothetical protein
MEPGSEPAKKSKDPGVESIEEDPRPAEKFFTMALVPA